MKNLAYSLFSITIFLFGACNTDEGDSSKAHVKFTESSYDFGKIKHGAEATYEFEFENTGSEPLIITNVKSSCGCTVPSYPKESIMPGEKGSIKVRYDSNRVGVFHKSVKVYCNAKESPVKLEIDGEVESPENDTVEAENTDNIIKE